MKRSFGAGGSGWVPSAFPQPLLCPHLPCLPIHLYPKQKSPPLHTAPTTYLFPIKTPCHIWDFTHFFTMGTFPQMIHYPLLPPPLSSNLQPPPPATALCLYQIPTRAFEGFLCRHCRLAVAGCVALTLPRRQGQ